MSGKKESPDWRGASEFFLTFFLLFLKKMMQQHDCAEIADYLAAYLRFQKFHEGDPGPAAVSRHFGDDLSDPRGA